MTLLIVTAIIFCALYFFVLRQKGQYIPKNVEEISCVYLTRVSGNSMVPAVKNGMILSMNKCFKNKDDLTLGQIVLVEEKGIKRLGRIKERLVLQEGVFYKIGQDGRANEEFTVASQNVLAIQGK
jgi:hypothetical protein